MPLYTFMLAFMFCTYNGYLQSRYLSQYAVYADSWLTDPRFLTGFVLWLLGMLINIHSDHVLRNLRKPGETGYKIPKGGLFEYITAANYFGEVVEWCGYALASWSIQGWAFAVFTFCVLLTRAQQHHQWYHEKFEDYPKFRKIMIPFLSERPGSPQTTHHSLSLLGAGQVEKLGVGRGEAQWRPVQKASGTCSSLDHQVTSLARQGTGGILKEQAAVSPMKGTYFLEALSWEHE
ncbi:hypothetical protein E2I00_013137, partial [Balaenoptera physalus]